jgi:hypothetical protein
MYKFEVHPTLKVPGAGAYPVHPFVCLAVTVFTEESGRILLTENLMTDAEIDSAVDGIVNNLEKFRSSAKKRLKELRPSP